MILKGNPHCKIMFDDGEEYDDNDEDDDEDNVAEEDDVTWH